MERLHSTNQLRRRLDRLNAEMRTSYNKELNSENSIRANYLRKDQTEWVKARDEGLKLYLNNTPKAEREQRRLQFLGDVTAARILQELTSPDQSEESE